MGGAAHAKAREEAQVCGIGRIGVEASSLIFELEASSLRLHARARARIGSERARPERIVWHTMAALLAKGFCGQMSQKPSTLYLTVASQRPEHSCIKAGCIQLRCERADPPNGVREYTVQHYTPRRSTKITLNQLLSDFANYPRTTHPLLCQASCRTN